MTRFRELLLGGWLAFALAGVAAAQAAAAADPIAEALPAPTSDAVPTAPDAEDEEAAAATDAPDPETAPAMPVAPSPAPATPALTPPPQAAASPPAPGEVLPAGPQPYSALYPGAAPPVAPTPVLPPGPQPYTPFPNGGSTWTPSVRPAPQASNEPVHVDELTKTPDRPLTYMDQGYDQRLRSSFASAQGLQGPLDGSWVLAVEGAGDLYAFELVDRGYGLIEGAWRDLRRKGALTGSGFIDIIERTGSQVMLRFTARSDAAPTAATLTASADGRWSGELVDQGQSRPATLRRN